MTASELRLVVVGDSIPFSSFCAGCRGFVDQYATALEQATGRAVAVSNRSRDDSATLDDIVSQVTSDESLRTELGGADVVLVSVGFNDGPPYPPDRPCHSQPADTAEGQVQALLASTPECIDQTASSYEADYAAAFGEIETLTPPTSALMALTVYNNWLGHPELAAAATGDDLTRVTALTKRTFDAWNEMLCKVASQHRFRCVDVYHAFNGKGGDQPAGANLGGDYTHPSQHGNDVITGLLNAANITAKSG